MITLESYSTFLPRLLSLPISVGMMIPPKSRPILTAPAMTSTGRFSSVRFNLTQHKTPVKIHVTHEYSMEVSTKSLVRLTRRSCTRPKFLGEKEKKNKKKQSAHAV